MEVLDRITMNPEIMHGKPSIRGMQWTVEMIIYKLGSGMSANEIIADHPELQKEDIFASLQFAKLYLAGQSVQTLST